MTLKGKRYTLLKLFFCKPYGGNVSRDSSFSYKALHDNESLIELTDAMWGRLLEFNSFFQKGGTEESML